MTGKKIAAGIILIDTKTGDLLLGRRSFGSSSPNCWAPFGGKMEVYENSPKQAAVREVKEETGLNIDYEISKEVFYINDNNFLSFYTYIGLLPDKFNVILDESEHLSFGWFPLDNMPENLLPGFSELIKEKKDELKSLIDKVKQK